MNTKRLTLLRYQGSGTLFEAMEVVAQKALNKGEAMLSLSWKELDEFPERKSSAYTKTTVEGLNQGVREFISNQLPLELIDNLSIELNDEGLCLNIPPLNEACVVSLMNDTFIKFLTLGDINTVLWNMVKPDGSKYW